MKGDSSLRHRDLFRDKAIERESHLIERSDETTIWRAFRILGMALSFYAKVTDMTRQFPPLSWAAILRP
ncbi:UNVERIFIED_ORG: hypothetical protein GGD51_001287 [Rhizobium esperanzae]|nr:hypothetical protein AMC89_CH01612 [Rhizobium phaseoli]ANL97429.1 hypothetical protein AMC79_CH01608 [Rhizobium phaseoli]PWI54895.1 hypothetical protein B5K03_07505 [Rhizobium phaseoli]